MKKTESGKKRNPVNILIMDAFTDANVGSCALVENSYKIIKSFYKNPHVRVMAQYPEAFTDLYGLPGIEDLFLYPTKTKRLQQIWWLIKTGLWMLATGIMLFIPSAVIRSMSMKFFKRLEPFFWADIIVSVGAERLNDKYYKFIPFSLYSLLLGKLLKKKVIIFPSTIGPFFFKWSAWLTGKILSSLDMIYVRDAASAEILLDTLKVSENKMVSTVDVAVLQEPINRDFAYRKIGGVDQGKSIVGISILKWGYFKNRIETPYSNYQSYIREMAKTVDSLIEQYKVTIVFYPTNYHLHACDSDDLAVAYDILPLVKNKKEIKVINDLPTPAQLQGMLACSEINITTRMHACILSTNSGTPTISINYLFKLSEYMDSLGLSDFSIDIEEFSAEKLLAAFQLMWPEREKWRHHLEERIKIRKENLWASMEKILDIS